MIPPEPAAKREGFFSLKFGKRPPIPMFIPVIPQENKKILIMLKIDMNVFISKNIFPMMTRKVPIIKIVKKLMKNFVATNVFKFEYVLKNQKLLPSKLIEGYANLTDIVTMRYETKARLANATKVRNNGSLTLNDEFTIPKIYTRIKRSNIKLCPHCVGSLLNVNRSFMINTFEVLKTFELKLGKWE